MARSQRYGFTIPRQGRDYGTRPSSDFIDPYSSASANFKERHRAKVTELTGGLVRVDYGGPALAEIEQEGVGAVETPVREMPGMSQVPLQVSVKGQTTYRIFARAGSAEAWQPITDDTSTALSQYIEWKPFIRLEVTAGTGAATLKVG